MRRKIKPIIIGSHPSLYEKMEELRRLYNDQAGMNLSQVELTNILSKRIKMPKKINIMGDKNVKKNKYKKR